MMERKSGVLIVCKNTGRLLLLLENPMREFGRVWSMVAGSIEDGESAIEGGKREIKEELGIDPEGMDYYFIDREEQDNGVLFNFFVAIVDEEFEPILSSEHINYRWVHKSELPNNLYPGMDEKIEDL